jgi:hypothetical protein
MALRLPSKDQCLLLDPYAWENITGGNMIKKGNLGPL